MKQALFIREDDGRIVVDPAVIYPHYLQVIGHTGGLTQNALECARFLFTEDFKQLFGGFIHLYITKDERFRLDKFEIGPALPRLDVRPAYDAVPGTAATRLGVI